MVPSLSLGICGASAASVVQASGQGALVSSAFGMKWSASHMPSHPVAATCCPSASVSSKGSVGVGQKLNLIRNLRSKLSRVYNLAALF